VEYWVHRFEAKGLAGLQEGARCGRPGRLTAQQVAEIQGVLRKRPADFGLSGNLWDGKTRAAYLERAYRVTLGARQCPAVLSPMGIPVGEARPVIARAEAARQAEHKKKSKR